MRDQRQIAVGGAVRGIALRGGVQIRGIIIDNPSGSWLFISPPNDYVPPYTLGWARTLLSPSLAVDVVAGPGPAGEVSTQAGDPVLVWVDQDPVGTSNGSSTAFITAFTPVLAAIMPAFLVQLSVGLSGTLVASVVGRRVRLLSIAAVLGGFPGAPFPVMKQVSAVTWSFLDGATVWGSGRVTPDSPVDTRIFMPGLDFTINTPVGIIASTDWADSNIGVSGTYQLI